MRIDFLVLREVLEVRGNEALFGMIAPCNVSFSLSDGLHNSRKVLHISLIFTSEPSLQWEVSIVSRPMRHP